MDCAWVQGRARWTLAVVLFLFKSLGLSAKEVERILYKKSGLLGIPASADMRDLRGRAEPEARLAVDYFVTGLPRKSAAWRRYWVASTDSSSPPASGKTRRRSAGEYAKPVNGWGWNLTGKRTPIGSTNLRPEQQGFNLGGPNEELMIAQHTGRLLGLT